jgi:hypothetical protein
MVTTSSEETTVTIDEESHDDYDQILPYADNIDDEDELSHDEIPGFEHESDDDVELLPDDDEMPAFDHEFDNDEELFPDYDDMSDIDSIENRLLLFLYFVKYSKNIFSANQKKIVLYNVIHFFILLQKTWNYIVNFGHNSDTYTINGS